MKNYRIAIVEYEHFFVGMKRTYAAQRRIGLFFWYTMTYCDSKQQAETYIKNVRGKKKEKLINVLRTY